MLADQCGLLVGEQLLAADGGNAHVGDVLLLCAGDHTVPPWKRWVLGGRSACKVG